MVTSIDFSKYQSFKIVTTSRSLDKILLPAIEYVDIPRWWQEQVLKLNIDLPQLIVKPRRLPPIQTATNQQPSKQESTEIANISQMEGNIVEPVNKAPKSEIKINKLQNQLPTTLSKISSTPEKTITVNYLKSTLLKVTSNNQPIANSFIFIGYNNSQTIKKAGETNAAGEIKFTYNSSISPDIIIIKKDGFVTQVGPFIQNTGDKPVLYDLKNGKSIDFLVQSYAYNEGRGLDKTELYLNGAKQEVSTGLGFITLNRELKSEDIISLEQKNSILSNISSDDLKKQLQNNKPGEISTLMIPSLVPFKETVGLLEPNLTGSLATNKLWRRARREFFSRFINEQSFKTKIQDDLVKVTNLTGDALFDIFRRGWENASFAKDVDIVMQIDMLTLEGVNESNPTIVGRIYAKNGQLIAETKKSFNEANAEEVSSQLYNDIMAQLPIEGYVLQQEKGIFTINLGKKQHLSKGDLFAAFIPQNFYSPPTKPVAVLKVTEVTADNEAKATAVFGIEKLQSNIMIRIVRATQAQIENEMKKKVVEKL